MRTFFESTTNHNVPKDVFLIAEDSHMSGEIVTTFYADKEGNMWEVGDWKYDKPQPLTMSRLYKATMLSPKMVTCMYNRWRENDIL